MIVCFRQPKEICYVNIRRQSKRQMPRSKIVIAHNDGLYTAHYNNQAGLVVYRDLVRPKIHDKDLILFQKIDPKTFTFLATMDIQIVVLSNR